ncbi:MAG: hybrid sensor histidine kinase/response regulator, partial [Acidobacteria bacterium]
MKGARILVVDDDPQFSFVVKNLLELEGVETEIVHNSVDAMNRLMFSPFDAMLVD